MMKIESHSGVSVAEDVAIGSSPIKVCMHVLGAAHTDVRAMRAATALVAAGFTISFVDVEGECGQPVGEDIDGACVQHMLVPNEFITRRFRRWVLFRAASLFFRSTLRLLCTPADIYHALDLPALPACYVAAQLRGKPLIFESYELPLSTLPMSEISTGRRWLHRLLAPLLAHIVPRCAGVIAVSPPIVEEMSKRYHCSNIALIRNIPPYQVVAKSDRLRQQLGLDLHVRIALYEGYLQPGRGLDTLVRTAKFLEENIVIVLMGKDVIGTQARLEGLINSEGVADRIKIIPPVPYKELLDWTASADLGLIVSSPDYSLNIRWLLPNKLFEYFMAGLPVLASPLDAIVEILRTYDVGRVMPSLAPADVGAAINSMLADRVALASMRRNALEAAKKEFCWEKESQQLIKLYDEILAGRDTSLGGQFTLCKYSRGG